jgi:hypothetical protein
MIARVGLQPEESVALTRWPVHLELIDVGHISEPEVKPGAAG